MYLLLRMLKVDATSVFLLNGLLGNLFPCANKCKTRLNSVVDFNCRKLSSFMSFSVTKQKQ